MTHTTITSGWNTQEAQRERRKTIELIQTCEKESVENGYNKRKEARTIENKMERRVPTRNTGLRGDVEDSAPCRRNIISYADKQDGKTCANEKYRTERGRE